jgi:nucleoside phosphorylase
VPPGSFVSFGVAGALTDELRCGDVVDADRVVGLDGETLWTGEPLGVAGARRGTVVAGDEIVDGAAGRRALSERTGAIAVDLESGPLARSGQLRGVVRAIGDTPGRPLGELSRSVDARGDFHLHRFLLALARAPLPTIRAARDGSRALRSAARAAEALR